MKHRTRLERAEQREVAANQLAQGQPLRQVATDLGIARSTLRDWCMAAPVAGLPPEVAACLATPAGTRWLHRLVVVMHLIITLRAGAGVRLEGALEDELDVGLGHAVEEVPVDHVAAVAVEDRAPRRAGAP